MRPAADDTRDPRGIIGRPDCTPSVQPGLNALERFGSGGVRGPRGAPSRGPRTTRLAASARAAQRPGPALGPRRGGEPKKPTDPSAPGPGNNSSEVQGAITQRARQLTLLIRYQSAG